MKVARRFAAGVSWSTSDRDLIDAMFLHRHPGWKPEDLGYPPRDYILIDLMREMT